MKNATAAVKAFKGLLKKMEAAEPHPDMPDTDDLVGVLVMSFLLWESTTGKAIDAYRRLHENIVDYNDLRVSMPRETVEIIGERYPKGLDRTQRLRAALRDIYLRDHEVSLESLKGMGKRDIKKYVESLDGIVPYVSARVLLLCFDTHAIPVDEQLRRMLVDAGAAEPDSTVGDVTAWVGRQIKATQGVQTHHRLQAWVDANAARPRGGTKKKTAAGETTRKTTTKSAAKGRKTTKKKAVGN